MEKLKRAWSTVIMQTQYFKITVREVIVALVMILVLSFTLVRCEDNGYLQRVEALEDTCTFSNRNISALHDLLERSDLCSERWFEDYQDYMDRLIEQNEILETMDTKRAKEIYPIQVKLVNVLKNFYDNQSEGTLKDLQKQVEKYHDYHKGICKGEGF